MSSGRLAELRTGTAASPTGASHVDIARWIDDARADVAACASSDPTYAELMATYAELGELLDSGKTGTDYVAECAELVERLVALGRVQTREMAELWALWCLRHLRPGRHDR